MLSKTPFASKASTKQKTYSHGDFEGENYIGAARSGRFKESFYQQIVSTQNTDCVPFDVQLRTSRGRAGRMVIKREVLRSQIDVAHEQLL